MKRFISISLVVMIIFSFALGINATLSTDKASEESKSMEELTNEEKMILDRKSVV